MLVGRRGPGWPPTAARGADMSGRLRQDRQQERNEAGDETRPDTAAVALAAPLAECDKEDETRAGDEGRAGVVAADERDPDGRQQEEAPAQGGPETPHLVGAPRPF